MTKKSNNFMSCGCEYVLRVKVTTEDDVVRGDIENTILTSVFKDKDIIPGLQCVTLYKESYKVEDIINDVKQNVLTEIKDAISEIHLTELTED